MSDVLRIVHNTQEFPDVVRGVVEANDGAPVYLRLVGTMGSGE